MTLTGAIFDLDGTLLNSMNMWKIWGTNLINKCGIVPDKYFFEKTAALSLSDTLTYITDNYKLPYTKEELTDFLTEDIEDFYFNHAPLKKGVAEMLSDFKSRGVEMCIATATEKYLVERALKLNHIDGYFKGIFTCTMVGESKTSPRIYREALNFLGTDKKSTYVFEDNCEAASTAVKDGFKVVGIYDETSCRNEDKMKNLCSCYLRDFTETYKIL